MPDEAALDALVLRLLHLKASKIFVWLVILVWFNTNMPTVPEPYKFVEFFAGDGSCWKSCKHAQVAVASLDLRDGAALPRRQRQNPFDMTTGSGFAQLGCS